MIRAGERPLHPTEGRALAAAARSLTPTDGPSFADLSADQQSILASRAIVLMHHAGAIRHSPSAEPIATPKHNAEAAVIASLATAYFNHGRSSIARPQAATTPRSTPHPALSSPVTTSSDQA